MIGATCSANVGWVIAAAAPSEFGGATARQMAATVKPKLGDRGRGQFLMRLGVFIGDEVTANRFGHGRGNGFALENRVQCQAQVAL